MKTTTWSMAFVAVHLLAACAAPAGDGGATGEADMTEAPREEADTVGDALADVTKIEIFAEGETVTVTREDERAFGLVREAFRPDAKFGPAPAGMGLLCPPALSLDVSGKAGAIASIFTSLGCGEAIPDKAFDASWVPETGERRGFRIDGKKLRDALAAVHADADR